MADWNRDHYTFTFIRSPWTRVLSAYIDKVEKRRDRNPKNNRWAAYARDHQLASFADFVHHLEKSDPADMNPHWAPQSLLLMRDRIDYDFIGKFEDMERDGAIVLERLGIPGQLSDLSHTHHQTGADQLVADYYTPELVEIIGRIYAEDVELGSYSAPVITS